MEYKSGLWIKSVIINSDNVDKFGNQSLLCCDGKRMTIREQWESRESQVESIIGFYTINYDIFTNEEKREMGVYVSDSLIPINRRELI